MKKLFILAIALCSSLFTMKAAGKADLVDYVNPLVGSQSKISLSTGNTYPAIAMPWGIFSGCPGHHLPRQAHFTG